MPIVEIQALPQPSHVDPRAAVKAVAQAVAEAMGLPARQVWAAWRTIESGHYVEGDVAADAQPRGTHPPIVNVIAFQGRPEEMIERVLTAVADTLTRQLDLEPGAPFVVYTEVKSGRVYTGGAVRRA